MTVNLVILSTSAPEFQNFFQWSPFEQIHEIPKIEDGIVLQVYSSFEATYSYGFTPHLENTELLDEDEGESENRISIIEADIERTTDSNYTITFNGKVLLTPQGIPIQHESRDLIHHIYDELDNWVSCWSAKKVSLKNPDFSSCGARIPKFVIENPETFDELLENFEVALRMRVHLGVLQGIAGGSVYTIIWAQKFINSLDANYRI